MIHGADYDIDQHKETFHAAYCVYWDANLNVILEPELYAETVYPISLVEAVRVFKPANAAGCNVNFEYPDGQLTDVIVFKF